MVNALRLRTNRYRPLLAMVGLLLLAAAAPHPIHTTMTELSYSPGGESVDIAIRLFVDDFTTAATQGKSATLDVTSMVPYVASRFSLRQTNGQQVPLTWRGSEQKEEVIWIRLSGEVTGSLAGGTLRNELIFDIHRDQVNIVRVTRGERETTLLFTRNAHLKELP